MNLKKFTCLFLGLFTFTHLYAGEFVLNSNEAAQSNTEIIGGKAQNLVLLQRFNFFSVPQWICITSTAFEQFLNENEITPLIEELEVLFKSHQKDKLHVLLSKIQDRILRGTFNENFLKELNSYYLIESFDKLAVAVRSSGSMEDMEEASYAGLYDTFLNQIGFESVCQAVKEVWISSFTFNVLEERSKTETRLKIPQLSVIIQEMINSKTSGVALSSVLSSNYSGIEITANYGLGESVVGGLSDVDQWIVHETENYIIKSTLGQKEIYVIPSNIESGNITQAVPTSMKQVFSLNNQQVLQVAQAVKELKTFYSCNIDLEFAFDPQNILRLLQVRPLVVIQNKKISVVDPEKLNANALLAEGDYSLPGVVQGKLKFINNWSDLISNKEKIEPDDIVVTYIALNYWSHYLTQFKGLITKQGCPTSHPILLCRERKVPCLIGMGNDFEKLILYANQVVTLDGYNRKVYAGKVKLKEAEYQDLIKQFQAVEVREWKNFKSRVFELNKGGHLEYIDSKYWLKAPTYPHKKLFQCIHLKRTEKVPLLINNPRIDYQLETKVIEDYVCTPIEPAEEYVRGFKDMTLEECETFAQNFEKRISDYIKHMENFELNSANWRQYVDILSDLKAYTWLVEIFRMYVDREAEKAAESLKIPQYYFDECTAYIQSQLFEEDTQMQQSVYLLAEQLLNIDTDHSHEKLSITHPSLYTQLVTLAKSYRFISNTSIEHDLDLSIVYKKVLEEKKQIEEGKNFYTDKNHCQNKIYFPQNDEVYRWLYTSISNRITQSNSHHIIIRNQWKVREMLIQLSNKMLSLNELQNTQDIFDLSPETIDLLIQKDII